MSSLTIGMAAEEDSDGILSVYAPYVADTAVSFEFGVPGRDDFRARIRNIVAEYPCLVCRDEGKIVGYSYAHRHKERAAYGWNAELTIYIDESHTGKGIGAVLYGALLEILKLQNVRNVYGLVTAPNKKSEGLHRRFGFELSGVYHKTGYKRGKWHDVLCFEKQIGDPGIPPKAFIPISRIGCDRVNAILESAGIGAAGTPERDGSRSS